MSSSIARVSYEEEMAAWRLRSKKRFSVKAIADYLGCSTSTVRAAMRRMSMKKSELLSKGQVAKVLLHIRERQGHEILEGKLPKRKVSFMG